MLKGIHLPRVRRAIFQIEIRYVIQGFLQGNCHSQSIFRYHDLTVIRQIGAIPLFGVQAVKFRDGRWARAHRLPAVKHRQA
jgi:hypothetical protein